MSSSNVAKRGSIEAGVRRNGSQSLRIRISSEASCQNQKSSPKEHRSGGQTNEEQRAERVAAVYYDHEEQSLNITVQRASQREHQPAREEQHHCAAVKRGRSERSKEQQSLNMTELEEHRSGSEKQKQKSKRTAIAEHH